MKALSRIALPTGEPLLEVDNLRTHFDTLTGPARSVDGVSYTVRAGQTLGVVGESGCGKSVTALSIMRLLATPPARISGSVRLRGIDLLKLTEREMRQIRGNRISMIFQEPMTSLNPVLTIGRQIAETVQVHQKANRSEALARAVEMLRVVQIPEPERRVHEYPHQLSGGMRQRVMIALALACNPEVLIADEPTTALDVTIQAQILDLMRTLQRDTGTAIILITHDLGVVAEVADEVVVMYAGRVVERAPVRSLFDEPQHPYTIGLLGSIPRLDRPRQRLASIEGQVPSPLRRPTGCGFADRCPFSEGDCRTAIPPLRAVGAKHQSACRRVPLDPAVLMARWPEAAA